MPSLQELEQKYQFKFPNLYHRLAQSDCLDKIFNREVKTYLCIVNPKYSYEFQGLLSHEECKMILQEMIHFQDLDLTFKYMQN